ncbi:alanine racemase [Nitratiruptor tergarcus]|uniref:Alanine racemase n=1 Tax=Nitratiruptor tergarcus DSM 16512 TaxID=1069081 RepID=A0A1W1WSK2_9BACT|nr:alanine racemase [Nitratiruptor tergarcus]SMC09020.1 alanine racemase [Nitratiruptor tergarcus DSM 16512]
MAYIKLSKNAFFHNLELIAKKAGGNEKVAIVLKDNAYGHGLLEIAKLASEYGIKRAVVRNTAEAKEIENLFDYILILADAPQQKEKFHYTINSLEDLKRFPTGSHIELKIDTGMHRNGIVPDELEEAFKIIQKRALNLKGVFTHFRSADELSSELFWQERNFDEVKKRSLELVKRYELPKPLFHSCNSAALFRKQRIEDDFARVGIAAYGYLETDEIFKSPPLKPVLSLWARRLSSRVLKKGQRVGYGGVFEADRDMVVSAYDIGYGDGIFRAQKSIVDGKILGRVSMDNIIVEGKQDKICIFDDAKRVAKEIGTISYEVLVKLSPNLARIVCE